MSVFFNEGSQSSASNSEGEKGVMTEIACEPQYTCAYDQYAFKGLAAQWLGAAQQVAPFIASDIYALLQSSAQAAAASCTSGKSGTECGSHWSQPVHNDKSGVGQELSAMNVVLANLALDSKAPATQNSSTAQASSGASAGGGGGGASATSSGPHPSHSATSHSSDAADLWHLRPWGGMLYAFVAAITCYGATSLWCI